MYLNANSHVKIGELTFNGVTTVQIEDSVKVLGSSAVLTLPRNYEKLNGKAVTDFIHRGDRVSIFLGYNGTLRLEFEGYVSCVGSATPLKIECDSTWFLHKKNKLKKAFKNASLKDIIAFAFAGYEIDCPHVKLGKYILSDSSSYGVAVLLVKQLGIYIRLDETAKKIYAYYPFQMKGFARHTYVFGTKEEEKLNALRAKGVFPNIKQNKLNFERAESNEIRVLATAIQANGKKIKLEIGSKNPTASKRTLTFGQEVTNENDLRKEAEKYIKKRSFDGYNGSIVGYGIPCTEAGDELTIMDANNPEREGTYLIESVKKTYTVEDAKYERENTLSYKI